MERPEAKRELRAFLEFEMMVKISRDRTLKILGERKETYTRCWKERFIKVES